MAKKKKKWVVEDLGYDDGLETVYYESKKNKNISPTKKEDKNFLDKVGYTLKSFGAGMLGGTTGILKAGTQEASNNLKKGEEDSILNNILGVFNASQYLTNPAKGASEILTKGAKTFYDNVTDKDKTGLEKAVGFTNDSLTNAVNATAPKKIFDETMQLYGSLMPNLDTKVDTLGKTISKPYESVSKSLNEESKLYGGGTKLAGDVANVVGNMVPSIATTLLTKNPTAGLAVMGASVKGQSTDEAIKKGATLDEAIKIGNTKAAIEIGTEMLTGGVNVFGKGALDTIVEKGIDKKVKKEVANYLSKKGVGIAGEVLEETISDTLGTLVDKGTVDPKASYSFDDWEDTAVTTILSTLVLNAITGGYGKRSYMDNAQQLKQTEEQNKVIDYETTNRVNEKEKTTGKKLNEKEVEKINKEVREDFEKGYISTDTIESVLGGDTYNQLKELTDKQKSLREELNKINNTKASELTIGEQDTYRQRKTALEEELGKIDTNTLRSQLDAEMNEKIKSDNLLQLPYQEKANRSNKFEADITKYQGKQQETIQKAIDSGILNNTRKTHEFVDMVAKLSADKGVSFDFTNNTKLKDSGFAVDGKQVNGFVNQNGITVNIDSNNALNSIVGHEITHILEGTELYTELQQAVKEYATTKGVYDTKLAELTEMYKNVEGANVENELTSDLVGEYLFTDADFVKNLSATKPNVFQKIFNEIKYMLKIATAGSKEARQLEKVKKTFEEAYRNSGKELTNDTKYSISENKELYNKVKNEKQIAHATNGLLKLLNSETVNSKTFAAQLQNKGLRPAMYGNEVIKFKPEFLDYINSGKMYKGDGASNRKGISKENNNKFSSLEDLINDDTRTSVGKYNEIMLSEDMPVSDLVNMIEGVTIPKNSSQELINKLNELGIKTYFYEASPSYNTTVKYSLSENNDLNKYVFNDEFYNQFQYEDKTKINKSIEELKQELSTINENTDSGWEKGFKIRQQIRALENGYNSEYDYIVGREKERLTRDYEEGFLDKQIAEKKRLEAKNNQLQQDIKESTPFKNAQYQIIQESNPMFDEEHVGIRSPKDIKTFEEAINDEESFTWGDYSKEDALRDLKKGTVRLYSSYPIKNGTFVSTSYQQALDYAGGDPAQVHSRKAAIDSVAWINGDEGQYAKVYNYSLSNENDIVPTKPSKNDIYGSDIKYQEEVKQQVEDVVAPLKEEVKTLTKEITDLKENIAPTPQEVVEQQSEEAFNTLTDIDAPIETETIQDNLQDTIQMDKKSLKMLSKNMKNDLGLNRKQTEEIENIIQDFSTREEATRDELFDAIKERFGTERIETEIEDIKNIQRMLKETRIDVSQQVKNDIADYNKLKQKNFGKIRFSKEGLNVDQVYQELSSKYPDYFPSDVWNESDQFLRIVDVANMDNKSIEEYAIPDEYVRETSDYIYDSIQDYKLDELKKMALEQSKIPIDDKYAPIEEEPVENASNRIDINNIEPIRNDGIAPIYKDPTKESTYDEIAEILETEPKKEDTRNNRKWAIFKAAVLDKGSVFEDLSLKAKNRELMSKWDYTLTSQARAQTVIGEGHYAFDAETQTQKQTSKSLNAIREEVDNTGLTKEFSEYIYHKHNVDRMNLEAKAKKQINDLESRLKEATNKEDIKAIESEIKALQKVKNKPVFGDSVTSETSQRIVDNYERSNPEFINFANDVYEYLKADRQELVKEGVISQETANLWQEMYPHYVPVRRVDSKGVDISVPLDTGRTGINAPIKKATGGNTDILPLFDTIAMRTLQTYRATAKNSFGLELMNTLDTPTINETTDIDTIIDSVDNQDGLLQEGKNGSNPTFTVFDHGEKITYEITKDMYDALKPVSDSSLLSKTIKPLNVASNIHRGVLTQYNLFFALTNAVKDAQDVLMNSQHAAKTYATVPEAWAQQIKKGYWYQEYLAHGGEQNSYFDSHDNTFVGEKKGIAKLTETFPLKSIATINDFIEMTPRLAEYIASRKAGRSIETAMLDSARVTTNFKAGGDFTKFLNRNGATFLNASVQGFNQQIRNIREANAKGLRGWANLATKFVAAGLPALLLNALLWEDDDDYEELSDYVKQNYYVVAKYGDGQFIRIPKGRTLAVIQNAMEQIQDIATGNDEADLQEFISMFLNNLAPNNPIENNILSPIIQVATNKAWYGGDLVPTRLQDLPAAEQYDESTDAFSKFLGEKLNISPYKINYVLDQYTGFLGDIFMPMATPEAKSDADSVGDYLIAPLKSKFTADSVMNNQNVGELFDTSEELATNAKKSNATDEDALKNKFINSMKSEMNELYKQKREIQNSDLSKSEKYNQVREIQKEINALAKSALNNYEDVKVNENYASVNDIEYYKHLDSEGKEVWTKINSKEKEALNSMNMSDNDKNNYFTAKNTISGIVKEYKNNKATLDDEDEDSYKEAASSLSGEKKATIINTIKNSGLNDEQKAYLYDKYYASTDKLNVVVKTGISMDSYLDLEAQNFQSDKNYEGKTISGSKKKKVFDYINSTDLDFEQRLILAKMYYPSYDEYNYDIIDYLNNNEYLDFDSEVKILKTLGFEVSEDGTITWK